MVSWFSLVEWRTKGNMKKEMINVLKFTFSSLSSYIGELLIFVFLITWLKPLMGHFSIIIATVIGRTCSSIYCYYFNSRLIFESKEASPMGYYILIVVQMLLSAVLVYLLSHMILIKETYMKMFVDTILFVISYFIQKKYIFHSWKKHFVSFLFI